MVELCFESLGVQVIGDARVEALTGKALKDINKSHDGTAQVAAMATFVGRSSRMVFAGRKEVRLRQGYGGTTFALRRLVEAAGVEPASEIAVSQESSCLVRFLLFHSWRSERTRCDRS